MQTFAYLTPHVHFLMGHRCFGDDMWARYIIKVIVPYCAGAPATFSWTPLPSILPTSVSILPWNMTCSVFRFLRG